MLVGLAVGDKLDLAGLADAAGASAFVLGSLLSVESGGVEENFKLSNAAATTFTIGSDTGGDVLLTASANTGPASTTIVVGSEALLNQAILAVDSAAAAGAYTIDIAAGANIELTSALEAINLKSGVALDIEGLGAGATLDGANASDVSDDQRGLFVYSGVVTIANLTIENMKAIGGGGVSGGGGAGLGGGLFVAGFGDPDQTVTPNVTLDDVIFSGDSATGGAGGAKGAGLGGGGLGGAGGVGAGGGGVGAGGGGVGAGGGGVGAGANGGHYVGAIGNGQSGPLPGAAGIIPGAARRRRGRQAAPAAAAGATVQSIAAAAAAEAAAAKAASAASAAAAAPAFSSRRPKPSPRPAVVWASAAISSCKAARR